jgi:hypothetical protein
MSTLRTAALTASAALLAASVATPALADDTEWMPMPLPCTEEPYLFAASSPPVDWVRESVTPVRYHERSRFSIDVVAVPDGIDGPTYTGRITYDHVANDGSAGEGHAVSTFSMRARLVAEDGSTIRAQDIAHITATARPDQDPASLIRVFFEHARCSSWAH